MTKSGWLPIGFLHTWMDWYQISINGVIIRFWKTQNLPDFNLSNVARCFPFKIIFSRTSRLFPMLLEDCSLLFFITADLKPVKKTGFVSHWPGFQFPSFQLNVPDVCGGRVYGCTSDGSSSLLIKLWGLQSSEKCSEKWIHQLHLLLL